MNIKIQSKSQLIPQFKQIKVKQYENINEQQLGQAELLKYKKLVNKFQKQLQVMYVKNKQLQQHVSDLKQRSLAKQKQLNQILEQLKQYYHKFMNNPNQVNQIFKRLMHNFGWFNQATLTVIQSQYNQTMITLKRKIYQILETFNQQISKKKNVQNIIQIRRELQKVSQLAVNTQLQNLNLRDKLKKQQYNFTLLDEQKKLLVMEVLQLRKLLNLYAVQNKSLREKLKQQKIHIKQHSIQQNDKSEINLQSLTIQRRNSSHKSQKEHDIILQNLYCSTNHTEMNVKNRLYNIKSKQQIKTKSLPKNTKLQRKLSIQEGQSSIQSPENTIKKLKSTLYRQKQRTRQLSKLATKFITKNQQKPASFCDWTKQDIDIIFTTNQKLKLRRNVRSMCENHQRDKLKYIKIQ